MGLLEDIARLVPGLRFRMVEPQSGHWSNNPAWGRNIVTRMPAVAGVAFSVGESPPSSFPGPPSMHTVQLFRGDTRTLTNAEVKARVSYGVGGTNNEFFVDWATGAQFSLVASFVRIDAVTYNPNPIGGAVYNGNNAELVLGATFGRGSLGHGPPLTLTEPLARIAPGNVLDLPVPDFARAVIVRLENGNNSAADPGPLTNWNPTDRTFVNVSVGPAAGTGVRVDAAVFGAGGPAAWGMPISGHGGFLRVANVDDTAPAGNKWLNGNVDVMVQWVLSL